ncbi:hypothetical protein [Streptomyces xanthii]|uniref:Uncharacterized protein n=1 Tax=Streptomyces xanthii TaxID=2768069 RepID=A0A7H1B7V5_9ACTN|nr:hypothetical protein [Streptomyces xanthii]QNS04810.1 hypothetical protein IAG42_15085 [Streptomyces xanthii]
MNLTATALTTALATAALLLTTTPAAPHTAADGNAPEADLAHHGTATLTPGRTTLHLTPQNHGPADIPDATVRLTWSTPLADAQTLPPACLRTGPHSLACRTGALPADTTGTPLSLDLRLAATPSELTLTVDTVFTGGPTDHNPDNDHHRLLVLDTGDTYTF